MDLNTLLLRTLVVVAALLALTILAYVAVALVTKSAPSELLTAVVPGLLGVLGVAALLRK